MEYDYAKATKRIIEMRRKVIAQKDECSEEHISFCDFKLQTASSTRNISKYQEN